MRTTEPCVLDSIKRVTDARVLRTDLNLRPPVPSAQSYSGTREKSGWVLGMRQQNYMCSSMTSLLTGKTRTIEEPTTLALTTSFLPTRQNDYYAVVNSRLVRD